MCWNCLEWLKCKRHKRDGRGPWKAIEQDGDPVETHPLFCVETMGNQRPWSLGMARRPQLNPQVKKGVVFAQDLVNAFRKYSAKDPGDMSSIYMETGDLEPQNEWHKINPKVSVSCQSQLVSGRWLTVISLLSDKVFLQHLNINSKWIQSLPISDPPSLTLKGQCIFVKGFILSILTS